jgi:hypothetical protein
MPSITTSASVTLSIQDTRRLATWAIEDDRLNGQEKDLYLKFVKSMVRWDPAERKTAKELVETTLGLNC